MADFLEKTRIVNILKEIEELKSKCIELEERIEILENEGGE